jgi:2-oxoglutarate ferredoxin oxidoreductase subunit alpha
MAIPGTEGVSYTADGLEHSEAGIPSSQSKDHVLQLNKRERKLALHDYGPYWADVEGDADAVVITFGSSSGPAREAVERACAMGVNLRLMVLRLLAPARPEQMAAALQGVKHVIVVEQNHGAQLYRYLRAWYDFPQPPASYHRPGPLPLRPGELLNALLEWRKAQ